MPVYLDDNEGRKDFIREEIKKDPMVALDSSHFVQWAYAGSMGEKSETYDAYANLVGMVVKEFPISEYSEIIKEIQCVIHEEEEEYFETWASYADQISKLASPRTDDLVLTVDGQDITFSIDHHDPKLPDC